MKKISIIILLLASVACGDELSDLRAEIASLKHENAQLKKIVADMTQPLTKPKIATEKPAELQPVRYRRKVRSEAWVKTQYGRFADKIALIDGKYYDIGKAKLDPKYISKKTPRIKWALQVHKLGQAPAKITKVLDNGDVVAELSEAYDSNGKLTQKQLEFRVTGIENPCIGGTVTGWVIYVGKVRNMATYRLCRPLTMPEFREALNGGFRLVEWKREKKWFYKKNKIGGTSSFRKEVTTKMVVK